MNLCLAHSYGVMYGRKGRDSWRFPSEWKRNDKVQGMSVRQGMPVIELRKTWTMCGPNRVYTAINVLAKVWSSSLDIHR